MASLLGYLIGLIIGSVLPVLVLTWIVELVAFKNFDPNKRALFTTGTATAVLAILTPFMALDFQECVRLLVLLVPGAVIAFFWRRHGYRKKWHESERFADDFA